MRHPILCSVIAACAAVASPPCSGQLLGPQSPAEGAWYDTSTPGQGLMLDALPAADTIFATWFTYAADDSGAQRWYVAQLRANGPVASGPLYATHGGQLNQPPGAQQEQVEVGTLTLDFLDCATVRASYAITHAEASHSGQFVASAGAAIADPAFACTAPTKLRWPHAAPNLTSAEYAALAAEVFIPNNYAVHQGGVPERPDDLYLHSGIDIVTEQGDPIFALEDGVVRKVRTAGTDSGFTVTVETSATPGHGWGYVHILPEVEAGDTVTTGQRLGTVQFAGLPHLHLSRIRQPEGVTSWDLSDLVNEDPTAWFHIPDDEAPQFRPQLLFFQDGTEVAFTQGAPTVVSGDVDIIAGIRDPGPHSRMDFNGNVLGDRHNVAWIEYEIAGDGVFLHQRAFDFHNLELTAPGGSPWSMGPWAAVVVVPILRVPVDQQDRRFNYYRVNHGAGDERIELDHAQRTWATDAVDAQGARLYPDGLYTITVRAADWAGNVAQVQDTVEVRND